MIDAYRGFRAMLHPSDLGIAPNGFLIREERTETDKSYGAWDEIRERADNDENFQYPRSEEIGLKNIGKETFNFLETPQELEDFLGGIKGEIIEKEKPYRIQQMAPNQLESAHLGVGWQAPQVDPNWPGMHTGSLNDQKLLKVLWLMTTPEDRDLHPPGPKMVDGRLVAVWRTSTERGCNPKLLKQLERLQGRVADRLGGNKAALKRSVVERVIGGLIYRFHSFFRGSKEGIADPRNKGRIAAVVVLISVPTSVGIYAIVYGIQYHAVKHELYQIHSQKANAAGSGGPPSSAQSKKHSGAPPPYSAQPASAPPPYGLPPPYSVAAPAYPGPALPAYAAPSGNGTMSLSA